MNVPFGVRLAMAIAMPLLIVNRGYKMKCLSFSGACSSLVVGFLLTFSTLQTQSRCKKEHRIRLQRRLVFKCINETRKVLVVGHVPSNVTNIGVDPIIY